MPRIGRPPRLTPAIQQAIVTAVAAGVAPSTAGELVGLSGATVSLWLQRGKGEHPTLKPTPLYIAFFEAITRAQSQDLTNRVARINQAGRGGAVIYRKTTTHENGRTTVEERTQPPDWQADAWHLERRYSEQWGRKDRIDLRATIQEAANQVAAELGVAPEQLLIEAQRVVRLIDGKRDAG